MSKHKIHRLPFGALNQENEKSFSGHLSITGGKIFYWLFEYTGLNYEKEEIQENLNENFSSSSDSISKIPLIIWLNGGPGCSSLIGQFLESGTIILQSPSTINNSNSNYHKSYNNYTFFMNQYSFSKSGHVLYIDQPFGTGYSYPGIKNGYCRDDNKCNLHFYEFLQKFFKVYPQFKSKDKVKGSREIYFTGESHAGHFIPSVTTYIVKQNDKVSDANNSERSNNIRLNIKALLIGNGWIDPTYQYDVTDYAIEMGLIKSNLKNGLMESSARCKELLRRKQYNHRTCYKLLDDVLAMTRAPGKSKRVLIYDVRKYVVSEANFPPGHVQMEAYLNRKDVKEALHATSTPHRFGQCTDPPYFALKHQDGKGVVPEITSILERNEIDVVLFNGIYDMVCNYMSLERAIMKWNWSGQEEWNSATINEWYDDVDSFGTKKVSGALRNVKKLTSILVYDAGHMVAMDRRKLTLNILMHYTSKSRDVFRFGESISSENYFKPRKLLSAANVKPSQVKSTSEDTIIATTPQNIKSIDNFNNFHIKNDKNSLTSPNYQNNVTGGMSTDSFHMNHDIKSIHTGAQDSYNLWMWMIIGLFVCYLTNQILRKEVKNKIVRNRNRK